MRIKLVLAGIAFHLPEIILASLLIHFYPDQEGAFWPGTAGLILLIPLIKLPILIYALRRYYTLYVDYIRQIAIYLSRSRIGGDPPDLKGSGLLPEELRKLADSAKKLDKLILSQKDEIDKFHELYQNIIFSISSYFLVLDEEYRVVFANEGFCKKFIFDIEDINGKHIDEIFYFVNARLRSGLNRARNEGMSVVLERTHLLSINKISIIADIKISNMILQGHRQVILIIDDVTGNLRKDYQISLLSHISESIQSEVEIERVLYTILTAVTSGSGLGFNRAMLFLIDENGSVLKGKMAVGPDSLEEAIEIWSAGPSAVLDPQSLGNHSIERGKNFLKKVISASFRLNEDSVFSRSIVQKEVQHVFRREADPGVGESVRGFMDVEEFVVAPIVAVNKPVGIICVDNKFNNVPIGKDVIELLKIFASQAAFSIESFKNLINVKSQMDKISRRQEAIVESEKMAAVGRIAAHIAHEIRNPLVTMGGYARRVVHLAQSREREQEKNYENIANAGNIILKESERLEKILSNVMDFTRPTKFIREYNNINEVINDTVELLKNLLLEKKIDTEIKLGEDIPLVKSDFNQMKQVILNLIQNSVDASTAGGKIIIQTDCRNNKVIVKVMDTGTGLSEESSDILFEPFYTTKVTGVGLGLSNVKKIVKDHGGSISLKNRPEGGTEAVLTLPVPG